MIKNIGPNNEIIKNIKHNNYTKNGLFVIDDLFILSLNECKNSNVKFCIICESLITSQDAKNIADYYTKKFDSYAITEKTFNLIASKQNCAGIIIVTSIPINNNPKLSPNDLIIVCDGLENSGNIGTIFRTADATNTNLIIFTNIKAKINDTKTIRASRGTIFTTPFVIIPELKDCIEYLKKLKTRIVICEPEQGINYNKFNYNSLTSIIIGSERYGVSNQWFNQKNCEYIKIPMNSSVGSLNVGVAASIIMYEAQISKNIIK